MEELTPLVEKLREEAGALERELATRVAEEDRALAAQEARLFTARATTEQARLQLEAATRTTTELEARRAARLAWVNGWRGQLWEIGHGSAASVLFIGLLVSWVPLGAWLPSDWTWVAMGAQAVLFAVTWFLSPVKR